jgi:hypothetical protein
VRRPPAHVLLVRSESLLGSRLPQILYLPTGKNRFTIKLDQLNGCKCFVINLKKILKL